MKKIVYYEKEDDIEYLKDNTDELKGLKNNYFNKNKHHDYKGKYLGKKLNLMLILFWGLKQTLMISITCLLEQNQLILMKYLNS